MQTCKVCEKFCTAGQEWMNCWVCKRTVHMGCTIRKSTPGGICGDIFYRYTCPVCSEGGNEKFERDKMSWFITTFLVMYHCQHKSFGSAKRGYFHWRHHIVTFIDKHWEVLFPKEFKRKKNWTGAISSTLSIYSPLFFSSGANDLSEPGWWRLTFPRFPPRLVSLISNQLIANKQMRTIRLEKNLDTATMNEHIEMRDVLLSLLPFEIKVNTEEITRMCEGLPVHAPLANGDSTMTQLIPKHNMAPVPVMTFCAVPARPEESTETIIGIDLDADMLEKDDVQMDHLMFQGRAEGNRTEEPAELIVESSPEPPRKKRKQLKPNATDVKTFNQFWNQVMDSPKKVPKLRRVREINKFEEKWLLNHVPDNKATANSRLYRKLVIREEKRAVRKPVFDLHRLASESGKQVSKRFHLYGNGAIVESRQDLRMVHADEEMMSTAIISPYTSRILRPYIRRMNVTSPWSAVMHEMMQRTNPTGAGDFKYGVDVDFMYVKPWHIPVINNLCERHFWGGINCSDTLDYPEFSIVAMYKKIVVGFGFMMPDVEFNEAYISFLFTRPEWRNCGIGRFMIYHLIQTCQSKDITLHVSVTNPAAALYTQMGFKVEKTVLNFYNTYMSDESKHSKHAYFMKLDRLLNAI